jgi:AbiU2
MATTLDGDYSKYPAAIRDAFARVAGETCALQEKWLIYHRFFMEDKSLTNLVSERLGPLLGLFQAILEDTIFLSISRLTDKDTTHQPNLSVWTLRDAVSSARSSDFAFKVDSSLNKIWNAAADIRTHRHKRIAHFDYNVGLKANSLPVVQFAAFKTILEVIEDYLNLFFWEFEQKTMVFRMLSTDNITGKAEMTAMKAHVYDLLEQNGTIPRAEWLRQWQKRKRSDPNQ